MKGIRKREDGSIVCTRLFALGYGEGINQLGISNVNPTKLPYIEADTIGEYGIIEKIWCDRRYQIEDNLYHAAKAKLEKIKQPKITYEIEAAELWALTGIPIDKFDEGDVIRVIDNEIGIDVTTRIVKKSKNGIENDYISASVQISSDGGNSTSGLTDLYERAKINETNSQGATNINNYNYYGNCDTKYPAKIRFRIPDEAVNINKIELSFQADAFRAFSKAIKGGGGTSSTTSAGGGTYGSTMDDGGKHATTNTKNEVQTTTGSGGGDYKTSDDQILRPGKSQDYTYPGGADSHSHDLYNHGHRVDIPTHFHELTIPSHSHDLTIPSHSHDFMIDSHYHTITLSNHVHDIDYGIYEGPSASKFIIKVQNG